MASYSWFSVILFVVLCSFWNVCSHLIVQWRIVFSWIRKAGVGCINLGIIALFVAEAEKWVICYCIITTFLTSQMCTCMYALWRGDIVCFWLCSFFRPPTYSIKLRITRSFPSISCTPCFSVTILLLLFLTKHAHSFIGKAIKRTFMPLSMKCKKRCLF